MARKKRPLPHIENLFITDAGSEGKAVGRYNDRVVFVPFAAPGDVVDVQVTRKRSAWYEARIERIVKPSGLRIKPKCEHFGLCGGCKWQHLDYARQLQFKEKQVRDALDRIAKVDYPEIMPILGSDDQFHYRNKLEFTFSNRKWLTSLDKPMNEYGPENLAGLGFHLPGKYDKILDIQNCYLQKDPSNAIRLATKAYAIENNLSFYNVKTWEGFLRNLIIRTTTTGDLMVIIVFKEDDKAKREGLLDHLHRLFPEITSLMYIINDKRNDSITDLEVQLYKGEPFITEQMPAAVSGQPALQFRIGPKSFYQTNSLQAKKLYQAAFDFADLRGEEVVYDLYSGTGTIALFIARWAAHVVGVEYVEEAVRDANQNASLNQIENATFVAGNMEKILNDEFFSKYGHPQVVIADPPRSGMHEKVIRQILQALPERIIYVSCNPSTQARDIKLLDPAYEVKKVQPVDMFPQTHHVENVVLLEKRKSSRV